MVQVNQFLRWLLGIIITIWTRVWSRSIIFVRQAEHVGMVVQETLDGSLDPGISGQGDVTGKTRSRLSLTDSLSHCSMKTSRPSSDMFDCHWVWLWQCVQDWASLLEPGFPTIRCVLLWPWALFAGLWSHSLTIPSQSQSGVWSQVWCGVVLHFTSLPFTPWMDEWSLDVRKQETSQETKLYWSVPDMWSPKVLPHNHQGSVNLGPCSTHCGTTWHLYLWKVCKHKLHNALKGLLHFAGIPQGAWPELSLFCKVKSNQNQNQKVTNCWWLMIDLDYLKFDPSESESDCDDNDLESKN